MKSTAIVCAIAASALGFSSLSFAQGSGPDRDHRSERREERRDDHRADRHDRRDGRHEQRVERQQHREGQPHARQFQERHAQQRHYQPQYQPQYQTQYRHHSRPYQWSVHAYRYQRGDHLPYQFRQRQYYVSDWRAHPGLYAPPYGYQWVQADGGDYLLVALATGLIANLLLNQF